MQLTESRQNLIHHYVLTVSLIIQETAGTGGENDAKSRKALSASQCDVYPDTIIQVNNRPC